MARSKRNARPVSRVPVLAVLLGALVVAHVGLIAWNSDAVQLWRLEHRARRISLRDARFRTDPGSSRYWGALALEARIESTLNASVTYGDPGEQIAGYAGRGENGRLRVAVDQKLSWNDRFSVLAHEGGHLLLTGADEAGAQEVFCDGVSFLTARRYGYDNLEQTAYHLAMYPDSLHALSDLRGDISWAADVLGGR